MHKKVECTGALGSFLAIGEQVCAGTMGRTEAGRMRHRFSHCLLYDLALPEPCQLSAKSPNCSALSWVAAEIPGTRCGEQLSVSC